MRHRQDERERIGDGSFFFIISSTCREANVIPFIIEDAKKNYYYRGLFAWRNEKGRLNDTCLDGQDTFIKLMNMPEIQ